MVNTEPGFGLELIEREAATILFNQLNDEIDVVQELWKERDEEWQGLTGQNPAFTILEHITSQNFYYGRRPSFIEVAPKEVFPNVSVMCNRGEPATAGSLDQAEDHRIPLDVEVYVKADESEAEEIVHRRMQRTAEATNRVMMRNQRINKLVNGFDNDPSIIVSEIFKRSEEAGHGPDWYFQAAKLTYSLTRHSNLSS